MDSIDEMINAVMAELDLNEEEIATRKAFLGFHASDAERLGAQHDQLHGARMRFIDAFHAHLLEFESTRNLIKDSAVKKRLRDRQGEYFESLTQGVYDWDYVTNRLRVGLVHQRVGLDPQWYLGAYCKYLTELLPCVWENADEDVASRTDTVRAILKIVFFDMGLALETYFHADRQSILALKDYAESVICSVPAGLLVLSADLEVLSANRFMDRLLEVGHSALTGRRLTELFDHPQLQDYATQVLGSQVTQRFTVQWDGETGPMRILDATLAPLATGLAEQQHLALGDLSRAVLVLILEDVTEREQLRSTSRQSGARIQAVLDNVADGIVSMDQQGLIESLNVAAERLFGYTEADMRGCGMQKLLGERRNAQHRAADRWLAPGSGELQGRRKDGSLFPMELTISEMRLDERLMLIGVVRDITARKSAEGELAKLAGALEQTADSVAITDRSGRIEYVNHAFEETTGYCRAEVMGRTPRIVKSGKHSSSFYARLWQTIVCGEVFRDVFINRRKDGELYYEEKTISPIRDALSGAITHFVSTGKDISDRMQVQQRLDYLAHHDVLTGMPNRLLLASRLQRAMIRAARHKKQMAILFLDLDHFKKINDTLGHEAGDRLLCAVAGRLGDCLRQDDTVARLGGDEFAALIEDLEHSDDVMPILEKLVNAMQYPFSLDGYEFFLTFSIGICLYPQDGEDVEVLLRNADVAMYRAKADGRNSYRFYTADMNARAFERLELENKLRRALERDEFVLHYQPKLDLRSGTVVGVEALLRWQHPQLGLVAPAEFIPTLEDTGMIVPVGRWVLQEACRQACSWRESGLAHLEVAVNVSMHQFRRDDVCAVVMDALSTYAMPPEKLELEITESALMDDVGRATGSLQRLKEHGVKVAIDDFGTGYSSLAYLKRFSIDTLKIDRTFVRDICDDEDDAAIVTAVVAMAERLHLKVVAEGVETPEQLEFLRQHGCDQMQGFLLSKPMPGDALLAWLSTHRKM